MDQTQFLEESQVQEAPDTSSEPQKENVPKKKNPVLLVMVAGAVFLLLFVGVLFLVRRSPAVRVAVSTPTPSALPTENSGIKQEIEPYLERIQGLNPEENDHPFPPVDFTVRLQPLKQ